MRGLAPPGVEHFALCPSPCLRAPWGPWAMGDQERHPVRRPSAPPEAPHTREREPVPECGLGTRSDPSNVWSMSPADQGRPG
eukprot:11287826-Alexandrium_andersonii.AAC.1